MHVAGIAGGVASGKSTVARRLEELGAVRLDADAAGHAVLREPTVRKSLLDRWGESILGADGELNRGAIAARVFAAGAEGNADRLFLERLTHPRIRRRLEQQVVAWREAGHTHAILDAPVMLEAGWGGLCDLIVFVEASEANRRKRAAERGWTDESWARREAAQWPLEKKRQLSNVVIDTNGSLPRTLEQVNRFWQQWRSGEFDFPTPDQS